ncbi:LysR family transcriptional regulator [Jidongwangia harbinensis]|uniref:LysR family transcriptional regulator n=1 Tax=Jidongwangia harbinensis TaxID=2878561 RepID=UPI001CD91ECE|nr:LysR family transcriptional regulator [Jidongwangia harbinensis]MCA2214281.1 LysR family transcriptional regulator [Jidongwangia harbinensis]
MGQLDLRRLRLLRELRDRGTVTAVAGALHMTSSAVSQQLALLSKDVGTPLLEPHGRRVRLTDAAQLLLRHADVLFAQLEQAQTELDAYVTGAAATVRVDCFATAVPALAVPAMRDLAVAEPRLTLRLQEMDTEPAMDRLVRDDTDLVVGLDGDVRVDDPRFERRPLLIDPLDVALPAVHPLAGSEVTLADLAGEAWILPPGGLCRTIALEACAAAGFTPREAHTADHYDAVFALVRAGLGVALVPRMCVLRHDPEIVVRALRAEQPRRQVVLYARRAGDRAPHLRSVVRAFVVAAASFSSAT